MKIKITHVADCQVKDRNKPLYIPTKQNLQEIESIVKSSKSSIHVIAGDLFEFAIPTESERKLIYEHILNLLRIDSLKELVIIAGNHDIVKEKKKELDIQQSYGKKIAPNAISIFTEVLNTGLNTEKLRYFGTTGIYDSLVSDKIQYIVYSREDSENDWKELRGKIENDSKSNVDSKINVCLYHAMIQEYVEYDNIPLSPTAKSKLDNIQLFPNNSIVLAGDIHKTLIFQDKFENGNTRVKFIYPGSTLQQTYKEGAYLPKASESKRVMMYDFETDSYTNIDDISITSEPLENHVCYNTLALDSKLDCNGNLELFKELIKSLEFGLTSTYLKIKSNNTLAPIERDIYKYVEENISKDVRIEFDYEQFVQENTFIDNSIVQELYDEKKQEILKTLTFNETQDAKDLVITSKNVDSLILNQDQLQKLFENILQNYIDKSNGLEETDVISNTVLDIFRKELEAVLDANNNRFDIEFKKIETNNFMFLGSNVIDLSLEGLTRIVGTNGIGKTTLFRMIRWVITGELFDGMQTNRVVQNNLLLFNTNRPDKDVVQVTLELVINRKDFTVKRTVKRNWKQNTTDEQKLSVNWKDFVSGLDRDFELLLKDSEAEQQKPNEVKKYSGEKAEKLLKSWFGNTIDTILFINQAKLYGLLNQKPSELNELILNYIGVDYLKMLEDRLDLVKDSLNTISAPKRNREEIVTDKKIHQKENDNLREEILENKTSIDSENIEIERTQKCIDNIQEELVELGNIPNKIKENEASRKEITAKIQFLNVSALKEKAVPKFTVQKPDSESFQKQINEFEAQVRDKDTELNILNEKLDKLELVKNSLLQTLNDKRKETQEALDTRQNELSSKLNALEKTIGKVFDTIRAEFNEQILNIKTKQAEKLERSKQIRDKIYEFNVQLKNGVCPTCGKPYEDDFHSFKEKAKEKIQLLEKALNDAESELSGLETKLTELQPILRGIEKEDKSEEFIKLIDSDGSFELLKMINELEDFEKIITEDSVSEQYRETLRNIDTLTMFDKSSVHSNFEPLQTIIDKIRLYLEKKQKYSELLDNLNKGKTSIQNNITDVSNKLQSEQKAYIDAQTEYREEVQKIIDFNNSIQQKRDEHVRLSDKLKELETEFEELSNIRLAQYETLQRDIEELKNKISERRKDIESIQSSLKEKEIRIVRNNSLIEQCDKEYNDCIQYMINNNVWKIYSKLIRTTFKTIVFEYYRNYLNNTLNHILSDVSFKLFWNQNLELMMVQVRKGVVTYQNVKQASGMETTFLGLALIYTIHLLNVKNSISNIFIDELSGTLNKGSELTYQAENYQELFVNILSKLTEKRIYIVDHAVEDLKESNVYEVVPVDKYSEYIRNK